MAMNYQEALAYFQSLEPRGWRLGLDRMQEFVRRAGLTGSLGQPGGPQFVHIAGTNGKGSVTAFLQSMMVECGHRTGAFFSPYVVDPRERVQLGRELISREEFARLATELQPVAESMSGTEYGGVTEFEFKTALGFACWKAASCDWVALEVGLGGRLDATNVVQPRASVIVSIGLDHTQILGHSLAEIAREKAGIVKKGVPAIVGQMPAEARDEILRVAVEREAPVWLVGRDIEVAEAGPGRFRIATPASEAVEVRPGLFGKVQGHNAAVAYAAMLASGAGSGPSLLTGLQKAKAPGRFQRVSYGGTEVVLDGAHNPDAARELMHSLLALPAAEPTVVVTGMVMGHDPAHFYRELRPALESVHVVPIDFFRAAPPEEVAGAIRPLARRVTVHPKVREGLVAAVAEAGPRGRVLVTGSFYLVGEVAREMRR